MSQAGEAQSFPHCPPLLDQLCSLLERLIQDFFFLSHCHRPSNLRTSQLALVVKNLPVNAGDIRDGSSIPGLGRFPGGGNGNPF